MSGPDQDSPLQRPLDIGFRSPRHSRLPVEVVTRTEIRERASSRELSLRQRADFHQLILCRGGEGTHFVDFEPIAMLAGRLLHVHPGQVQEFQFEPDFDAHVVVYKRDIPRTSLPGYQWFPGSDVSVSWDLSRDDFDEISASMKDLRSEQERFDGSDTDVALMEALLAALVARVHRLDGDGASSGALPETYVRFCQFIEEHFETRPTVQWCAAELGYSTRSLDRACHEAVGRTAKQVLDDRIALDIKRLLTHTDMAINRVGEVFRFTDPSSFSKFVHRHLGMSPSKVRSRAKSPD